MEYSENREGDVSKIDLSGKFTFADHEIFRGVIALIKQNVVKTVIFEMSKIEFIDSAALGMMLIAREEADKNGIELVIQSPSEQLDKMFKVSKFDSLFTIKK